MIKLDFDRREQKCPNPSIFGSWIENEVPSFVVFLQWFLIGWVSVNDCPAGLEPPAGARNRRKATVKTQRNPLLRFLFIICFLSFELIR